MSHAAYVFDAYGTLFDVHAAVRRHAGDVGPNYQIFSEIWRAKQLEYSWTRALMGAYADFWQLTEQALDYTFKRIGGVDPALRQKLLDAYWKLDCYPEVPAVLKALKQRGAHIAILSNGSPAMLASAVKNAALDTVIDDIFSVDAPGAFSRKFRNTSRPSARCSVAKPPPPMSRRHRCANSRSTSRAAPMPPVAAKTLLRASG